MGPPAEADSTIAKIRCDQIALQALLQLFALSLPSALFFVASRVDISQ
jgi:hypothetical protein